MYCNDDVKQYLVIFVDMHFIMFMFKVKIFVDDDGNDDDEDIEDENVDNVQTFTTYYHFFNTDNHKRPHYQCPLVKPPVILQAPRNGTSAASLWRTA